MNSNYKYYYFEDPTFSLIIAKDADDAVLEYQEQVADIRDGVTFEEVTKQEFLEKAVILSGNNMVTKLYINRLQRFIAECIEELSQKHLAASLLNIESWYTNV
jgi:hypothetical protein